MEMKIPITITIPCEEARTLCGKEVLKLFHSSADTEFKRFRFHIKHDGFNS